MTVQVRGFYQLTVASWLLLLCLGLAWELWLAPTSRAWALIKLLPLVLPLVGILRGTRRTYQLWCMLILIWFSDGVMRAWADPAPVRWLALAQVVLTTLIFVGALGYARHTGPKRQKSS